MPREGLRTVASGFDDNLQIERYIVREDCIDLVETHATRDEPREDHRQGLAVYQN